MIFKDTFAPQEKIASILNTLESSVNSSINEQYLSITDFSKRSIETLSTQCNQQKRTITEFEVQCQKSKLLFNRVVSSGLAIIIASNLPSSLLLFLQDYSSLEINILKFISSLILFGFIYGLLQKPVNYFSEYPPLQEDHVVQNLQSIDQLPKSDCSQNFSSSSAEIYHNLNSLLLIYRNVKSEDDIPNIVHFFEQHPDLISQLHLTSLKQVLASNQPLEILITILNWLNDSPLLLESFNTAPFIQSFCSLKNPHELNLRVLKTILNSHNPIEIITILAKCPELNEINSKILTQILLLNNSNFLETFIQSPALYQKQSLQKLDLLSIQLLINLKTPTEVLTALVQNPAISSSLINLILQTADPLKNLKFINSQSQIDNLTIVSSLNKQIIKDKASELRIDPSLLIFKNTQFPKESYNAIFQLYLDDQKDSARTTSFIHNEKNLIACPTFITDLHRINLYIKNQGGELIYINDLHNQSDPYPNENQPDFQQQEMEWKIRKIQTLREFCGYSENTDPETNELADQKLFKLSQLANQIASNALTWAAEKDSYSPMQINDKQRLIVPGLEAGTKLTISKLQNGSFILKVQQNLDNFSHIFLGSFDNLETISTDASKSHFHLTIKVTLNRENQWIPNFDNQICYCFPKIPEVKCTNKKTKINK